MGDLIDNAGLVSPSGPTDATCAEKLKKVLSFYLKQSKNCVNKINKILLGSPGGAQGCVDELSASEYSELTNLATDITTIYNDHRPAGKPSVSITIPNQTP